MTDELPWHSLDEASSLTGLSREAIRSRVRRSYLASRRGNHGELMVQVPPKLLAKLEEARRSRNLLVHLGQTGGDLPGPTGLTAADQGGDQRSRTGDQGGDLPGPTASDRGQQMADLREELARLKGEAEGRRIAAAAELAAAEAIRRAEVTALRELVDRLTAELKESRRPWWRRLIEG
jgi:hypothetical protein